MAGQTRRALVHTPADIEPGIAVPLVCMLHGCTQDAASFAAATRMNEAADRHGFIAVYPQQDRGENAQGCWNWFQRRHQARGAGEPASIAAVVRELIGTTSPLTIDPRRVFVAGLSAGGAMAAILGGHLPGPLRRRRRALRARLRVRDQRARRVPGDGSRRPATRGVRPRRHAAMGDHARPVPSIVVHGSGDRTVVPINGDQALEQSMTANRLAAPERDELDISRPAATSRGQVHGGYAYEHSRWTDRRGALRHELLKVEGWDTHGPAARPGAPTPILGAPTRPEAIWRFFTQVAEDAPQG